jgi:hypothetical protein
MAVANALAYFDATTIMTVVLEYRPQGIMKKRLCNILNQHLNQYNILECCSTQIRKGLPGTNTLAYWAH